MDGLLSGAPPAAWAAGLVMAAAAAGLAVLVRRHRPRLTIAVLLGAAGLYALVLSRITDAGTAGAFALQYLQELLFIADVCVAVPFILGLYEPNPRQRRLGFIVGVCGLIALRALMSSLAFAAGRVTTGVYILLGACLLYSGWQLLRAGRSKHDEGPPVVRLLAGYQRRLDLWLPADRARWRLLHRLLHLTPFGLTALSIALLDPFSIPDDGTPFISVVPYAFVAMLVPPFYRQAASIRSRIVFAERGSAVVLAFLGVKLTLLALHDNTLAVLNGGAPIPWVPDLSVAAVVVALTLVVWITVLASLFTGVGRRPRSESR